MLIKTGKFLLAALLLITVWQLAATWMGRMIFPTPLAIAQGFSACAADLGIHSIYSLGRIVTGVVLSLVWGLPLGVAMGYCKGIDKMLSPVLYLANPIPKIALLPIVMTLFGIGEASKMVMLVLIMLFPIALAVRDSVKNIPADYFTPFYTIQAGPLAILRHILIPASLADIFTSTRIGLATGISVLFFTETFGTRYGIGFFIMDMWVRLAYERMYAGILLLGLYGLALVTLLDQLEKRICKWK